MDLHRLRIFVAVARAGNFTRAAEQLHMAQPTVSQQIALLEAELDSDLIDRRQRRQRLTPAGEALLGYADRMLALAEEAEQETRAAAGKADRTLRLGVGHTLATYLLPDLLSRYRRAFPANLVRISVGNTAQLLDQVAGGAVELALVGTPADHADVEVEEFMRDRLMVIVAPEHAWSARTAVTIDELRDQPLLIREPGSALYANVERLLGRQALLGDRVIVLGETEAIKRCVEAGVGVAIVQGIAIWRETAQGTLRALTLHGGDDQRHYMVARRRRVALSYAARGLVGMLAGR
jgi:LysR family transcriptional regulator, low CO2-responsive transcriptional regulator